MKRRQASNLNDKKDYQFQVDLDIECSMNRMYRKLLLINK